MIAVESSTSHVRQLLVFGCCSRFWQLNWTLSWWRRSWIKSVSRVEALATRRKRVELLEICDAVFKVVVNCDGLKVHKLDAVQRIKECGVCQDDFADGLRQGVLIYPFLKGRHDG
jgi:hypothetical protein